MPLCRGESPQGLYTPGLGHWPTRQRTTGRVPDHRPAIGVTPGSKPQPPL